MRGPPCSRCWLRTLQAKSHDERDEWRFYDLSATGDLRVTEVANRNAMPPAPLKATS